MKLLEHIGWYGTKRMISIVADLEHQQFRMIVGMRNKEELQVITQKTFGQLAPMIEFLESKPNLPLVVSFEGAGVVEQLVSKDVDDIISQVLGVKVESRKDFLFQSIPIGQHHKLVALVRRDQIHQFLEQLGELQNCVIYINLTKIVYAFLLSGMTDYQATKAYTLGDISQPYLWKGKLQKEFSQEITPAHISDEQLAKGLKIPKAYLLAFASMFHFYLSQGQDIRNFQEINQSRTNHAQRVKLIHIGGWGIFIISILLMLLISSQQFFQTQVQSLQIEMASKRHLVEEMEENEAKITQQEAFLKKAAGESLKPSKVSFHLDQVMAQTPAKLYLDRVIYQPTSTEKKKIDAPLALTDMDLLLLGWAKDSQAISTFAQRLQRLPFVKSATMHQSRFDFETQRHEFILYVVYDDG